MFRRLLPFVAALVARSVGRSRAARRCQLGAAEDVVRAPDLVTAKAKMTLFRLAGFSSIRVTSQWQGTEAAPTRPSSRSSATSPAPPSSRASGSTSPSTRPGSRVTPLTPEAREEFAAYLTVLEQQLPVGRRT